VDGDEGGGQGASEVGRRADAALEKDRPWTMSGPDDTGGPRAGQTPDEINEMFDEIAYGKAGAVIGMVENYVGEEVFRAVQAYLAAHLYGNATAETSGTPAG